MQTQAVSSDKVITLKGSATIVAEFFSYAINSILYQRAICPPESFKMVTKYGLNMLVTDDHKLESFLKQFMEQTQMWLEKGEVEKMVVVITGIESKEVLERWAFDVHTETPPADPEQGKATKDIMAEIQAIIRQITSAVTFLPLLQEDATFDLQVYTTSDTDAPSLWEHSEPRIIQDSSEVRLRSFDTKIHKVDTMVSYKNPNADGV